MKDIQPLGMVQRTMGKNCQRNVMSSQCSREGGHQVGRIGMMFDVESSIIY